MRGVGQTGYNDRPGIAATAPYFQSAPWRTFFECFQIGFINFGSGNGIDPVLQFTDYLFSVCFLSCHGIGFSHDFQVTHSIEMVDILLVVKGIVKPFDWIANEMPFPHGSWKNQLAPICVMRSGEDLFREIRKVLLYFYPFLPIRIHRTSVPEQVRKTIGIILEKMAVFCWRGPVCRIFLESIIPVLFLL